MHRQDFKKQAILKKVQTGMYMGKIKQLALHEALKIAAGEVVERPVSIVKELVENALDAGATTIDIYIEEGGKTLIRVIDNGSGMDKDDAIACFLPHATSKITAVEDLERLTSFGFRGEALASIAAVSNITLKTKTEAADTGLQVTATQGVLNPPLSIGCASGTDITITHLFDNVPARKKFLKTVDTEWRQIIQLLQATALGHLQVHLRLYHFNQLIYNCPPTSTAQDRAHQLWDDHTARSLLPFTTTTAHGTIHGVLSNHQFMRYARSHMFVFINNRWVRSNNLLKAVMKGYESVLQPGKFPAAFLYVTVDPSTVDVNIHPRKEEVQLIHSKPLETALYNIVKETLTTQIQRHEQPPLIPALRLDQAPTQQTYTAPQESINTFISALKAPFEPEQPGTFHRSFATAAPSMAPTALAQEPTTHLQQELTTGEPSIILAQLHKTYILVEKTSGLWMIDQHAAHERILYETFRNRFTEVAATRLLFPERIHIDPFDQQLLLQYLPLLLTEGLEIEAFDEQQLVVYATPSYAKNLDLKSFIAECVHNIKELAHLDRQAIFKKLKERVHAMMACKGAIKAGDVLEMTQMHDLIQQLEKCPNKLTCPHGRPTTWTIRSYEIEKNFKRVV